MKTKTNAYYMRDKYTYEYAHMTQPRQAAFKAVVSRMLRNTSQDDERQILHDIAKSLGLNIPQAPSANTVLLPAIWKLALIKDNTQRAQYHGQVRSPADVANMMMHFIGGQPQEHLVVVLLDTKNNVIGMNTVYIGSVNTAVIRVAEIFRPAILANATAIIVCHNHPSGDPTPSPEDVRTTEMLVQAGELLDIQVLDHLVVGDTRYVSLKERGLGF